MSRQESSDRERQGGFDGRRSPVGQGLVAIAIIGYVLLVVAIVLLLGLSILTPVFGPFWRWF